MKKNEKIMECLKKHRNVKKRYIVLVACIFLFLFFNITSICGAEFLYKDCPWLHKYLVIDDFFEILLIGAGEFFYDILSDMLNYLHDSFNQVANFDILQIANVGNIIKNVDTYVWYFLYVVFIVAIVVKVFKIEIHTLAKNVLVVSCVVVMFSTILTLSNNVKNAIIKDVPSIIGNQEYKISELIYANNTIDIIRSLKNGKLSNLSVEEMPYFDSGERIKKSVIIDKPYVDGNGEVAYENLADGLWGTGDVRYLRYNTDFWNVNFVIFSSLIVYLLGIYKMCFLLVEWFIINIFGKFTLGRGFFNVDNLGSIFKSIFQNLGGQVINYAMLLLYSVIASGIMLLPNMNFISQSLLLLAFGFTILSGSTFLMNTVGIQDGSMKALGSIFTMGMMGRMFGRGARKLKRGVKKVGHGVENGKEYLENRVNNSADKMYDEHYQNQEDYFDNNQDLKDALNEDLPQYEHEQAKEDILNKEHKNEVYENAMRDLHGDNYKVQQTKDKIMDKEQQEEIHNQAMKELHGNDYKVKQAKDKIQGKEQQEVIDNKAMEELYGENHKVIREEKIIKQREEHSEVNDQAMKNLHGDDYKEKIMTSKAKSQAEYQEKIREFQDEMQTDKLGWNKSNSKINESEIKEDANNQIDEEELLKSIEKYD